MSLNISYWDQTSFGRPFDVLVIGGGIVGCAAALECANDHPGLRIGLIEQGLTPAGASTRNAGFACFGSLSEVCADIELMGMDRSVELIRERLRGLRTLLSKCGDEVVEYRRTGGYEVFLPDEEERFDHCRSWVESLNEALAPEVEGRQVFLQDDRAIGQFGLSEIAHLIHLPLEGTLHPGKLVEHLWWRLGQAGITRLSGLSVQHTLEEENHVVVIDSDGRSWSTRYLIIATNGYARHLLPQLDVYPARNQVYLTAPIADLKIDGCFHYNQGYVYFRNVGNRLLIGGARNLDQENEATDVNGLTDLIRHELETFAGRHILFQRPFRFEQAWSGIIGIGREKSPVIEMVGERICAAVRLSGMGVAIGYLVGSRAAQRILSRV